MQRTPSFAVVALLTLPALAAAQQPQQPASALAAAMRTIWQRAAANMPAAADDMPAEKFTFKPTPAQQSFAEIIAHEADANQTLCAALAGGQDTPTESTVGASAPKEQLVARLRQSFDYCGNVILQINETTLGDSIPFFGGAQEHPGPRGGCPGAGLGRSLRAGGDVPASERHSAPERPPA